MEEDGPYCERCGGLLIDMGAGLECYQVECVEPPDWVKLRDALDQGLEDAATQQHPRTGGVSPGWRG
jgi:hypothetical protein